MQRAEVMLQDEDPEEIDPEEAEVGKDIDQEEENELIRKFFDQDVVQAERQDRYEDEKGIQRFDLSGR